MNYLFETEHFGISEKSFHLLRSRFNYKTYQAEDLNEIIIGHGKLINNWLIILGFGIALISISLFYSYRLFELLNSGGITTIFVEEIVVPVIPILLGAYCLYSSLRSGTTLRLILSNDKRKNFPLNKLRDDQSIQDLVRILKSSPEFKNKTTVRE